MIQPVRFAAVILAVLVVVLGLGCAEEEPTPMATAKAAALTESVTDSGGLVARLSALLEDALRDRDETQARARVRTALEALVASAGCVSLEWSFPAVTAHFDDCHIPATDEELDGSLGVRLRLLQRSVVVTFDALTVGADVFDGSMTAYASRQDGALGLGVDADVTAVGTAATLVGSDLGLTLSLEGVTLSGSGDVISPSLEATATLDAVHWVLGDCLPSSGSVAFVDGDMTADVTFLETTPITGEVLLHVAPLPATTTALFPACP